MSDLTPRERYERDMHLLVQASRASPVLREAVRTVENHVRALGTENQRLRDSLEEAVQLLFEEWLLPLAAVSAQTEDDDGK